ncbi:ubiquinol oxidase subunit II [Agrobacterium pusense]|uniref:ubiquinol oxidase subunit II n=1 Tax=Agrobacterium pusense TaxID=648995 RepID=UPI00088FAA35|nr:ubiquinol oxidase subunit II [Agrobacterium pusense]OOO19694.1 ubiquinol oxidase subunit II [Agrobacterium pusense]WKD47918.1 ubiquinol oxidase subunit II [Agrobacterium pusense]SDF63456.1 cytochrome bo3 quinol oxidase subunit 2 [Agrobacterium pusense]
MTRFFKFLATIAVTGFLSGCNLVVMQPSGDIARQQRDLIVVSTLLMLLIILPVIFLTLFFAWKYRESNTDASYRPDWHHSTRLEVLIWSAPLAIIIALGAVTWASTHQLDPYRPLARLDAARQLPPNEKVMTVQVVALDWKWLFFYPELGIATVNELAAPVDVPISFKLTASSVMNTFYVPALAGMIYTMPGMQTRLHAVINREGSFDGFSANYSGDGFSRMRFTFLGMRRDGFDAWVEKVRQQGKSLDRATYLELERPSKRDPVRYFGVVEKGLYDRILNLCVAEGKICMNEVMHRDLHGPGEAPAVDKSQLEYDNRHSSSGRPGATFPASGKPAHSHDEIRREGPSATHAPAEPSEPGSGHRQPQTTSPPTEQGD